MDIAKATRTFQNSTMTYKEVSEIMCKDSAIGATVLYPQFAETEIGTMLTQYQETDWEFTKRLASRLNTCVVPDYTLDNPYLAIGMPRKSQSTSLSPTSYKIKKDIAAFLDCKSNGISDIREHDMMFYEVVSKEIFDLCQMVRFHDRQLYVYSISASSLVKSAEFASKALVCINSALL